MVYKDRTDLPLTIQETLPPSAQDVYIEAYNAALELVSPEGSLAPESAAHQVAWDAVTREFVHDDKSGKWYRKGEEPGPEEEQPATNLFQKIKNIF